jgi:hypothetical protein
MISDLNAKCGPEISDREADSSKVSPAVRIATLKIDEVDFEPRQELAEKKV